MALWKLPSNDEENGKKKNCSSKYLITNVKNEYSD